MSFASILLSDDGKQKNTRYKSELDVKAGSKTISTTDELSAVAAGLKPNTKYWFRVHAINGSNAEGQFGTNIKSKQNPVRMFARQLLNLQDLMQFTTLMS